jgi:DNA-binding transcriptional regulator LsrR (DeoR family)
MNNKYTVEQFDEATSMLAKKMDVSAIAEKMNLSTAKVNYLLKRARINEIKAKSDTKSSDNKWSLMSTETLVMVLGHVKAELENRCNSLEQELQRIRSVYQ